MSGEKNGQEFDAIVVGARAAGAATAMLLARQGLKVLAVDRGSYGSDTLSTLALMRAGVMQLNRWGLLEAVIAAGTPPVRRTLFLYGDETLAVKIGPAFDVDALYAPRRTVLDPILVDGARKAGAEIMYRVAVDDLQRDDSGRVTGILGRDEDQQPFAARAAITIGADGPKSRVARSVGAEVTKSATGVGGVIYGFFRGVGSDAYEWAFNSGGVASGVIPTNDDACCVFASTTSERFNRELRSDLEESFHRVLREVRPDMAERVAGSEQTERLRGFPGIQGYMRRSWGRGWALVGDAGYFKDPITAHGISDALRDAEILARAVTDAIEHPERESDVLAAYETTRDHLAEDLFNATDKIARYDWTLPEVQDLHRKLSKSMKAENKLLASYDGEVGS